MRRFTTILLACAVAFACGDSPTEPDPTVDGVWRGEGTIEGAGNFTLRLTMTEGETGQVSGTGALGIASQPEAIALTILGAAHSHPDLSVTLGATGYEDMTYNGVVTETQITGSLGGSGFTGQQVILVKQ